MIPCGQLQYVARRARMERPMGTVGTKSRLVHLLVASTSLCLSGCIFFGVKYDPCVDLDSVSCPDGLGRGGATSEEVNTGGESMSGVPSGSGGLAGLGGAGSGGGLATGGSDGTGGGFSPDDVGGTGKTLQELSALISLNELMPQRYVELYFSGASISLDRFSLGEGTPLGSGQIDLDGEKGCSLLGQSSNTSKPYLFIQQAEGSCQGAPYCVDGCSLSWQVGTSIFLLADGKVVDSFVIEALPVPGTSWQMIPEGSDMLSTGRPSPAATNVSP